MDQRLRRRTHCGELRFEFGEGCRSSGDSWLRGWHLFGFYLALSGYTRISYWGREGIGSLRHRHDHCRMRQLSQKKVSP